MQDLAGIAVLTLLMAALGGYLVGSIPFGVLLTRAAGAGDVRNIGSGNIGATNVLRTGRKDLAFATLILDAGKGAAALLIARAVTDNDAVAAIAGGAAFLGHLYPVWLGFKGGKGVATFFGLMLAAAWPLGLVAAAVWLLTAAVFRVSSLSALIATLVTPVLALMPIAALNLPTSNSVFLLALAAMTLIWLRHFDNIIRLIKGKEPRIGAKSA
ncbi:MULTISPECIES: glycerol-3-phosphate 1-O-acyltransferase PlsY [unclassified Brevundimonas]|uniref:glycerol-3-phosphate 1-O-acyltransferase PlsY n=1 Tax=unclassified Brevundimonas TaxID=2622653 RepID=UPI000C64065C|nr:MULTISPECIES: glycerol-3-phosphate 1-O-acyltransferase PlsY [unclassified Brevundimonas]MAL87591.1 acyl-phosphate glycerol 3-phosphate acyltransferase [Brevundimonas sp.]HAJ03030.1 acyl-phosphate glycerol 3-phosphate acyltransferase [Brevundimonas sp.]HAV50547.1 acyl-phosphate glycerol 3-phosphate acyltransferase [Brevundimonas sp.]